MIEPGFTEFSQLENTRYVGTDGLYALLAPRHWNAELGKQDADLQQQFDDYGLDDRAAYASQYAPEKVRFICAIDSRTGQLNGFLRLRIDYDITRFQNLDDWIAHRINDFRVVDVGGFTGPSKSPSRGEVNATLWCFFIQVLCVLNSRLVYAQCRESALAAFSNLGFRSCSPPFSVVGWKGAWCAVAMKGNTKGGIEGMTDSAGLLRHSKKPAFIESLRAAATPSSWQPSHHRSKSAPSFSLRNDN